MLHDRFPHFAAVQILRNYLKHRGNAVVGNIQKNRYSQENRNICRSVRRKCLRNMMACEAARWISEGSVICVVANPIEKFATRQRLGDADAGRMKRRQMYKRFGRRRNMHSEPFNNNLIINCSRLNWSNYKETWLGRVQFTELVAFFLSSNKANFTLQIYIVVK